MIWQRNTRSFFIYTLANCKLIFPIYDLINNIRFLNTIHLQVPLELLGHAQQILHRAMYTYGEDAPCYSAPRMLEEALKTDLRCDDFKDWSYSIESVDGSSIIRHHGIKLDQ